MYLGCQFADGNLLEALDSSYVQKLFWMQNRFILCRICVVNEK